MTKTARGTQRKIESSKKKGAEQRVYCKKEKEWPKIHCFHAFRIFSEATKYNMAANSFAVRLIKQPA
jgi:hypothetical protein